MQFTSGMDKRKWCFIALLPLLVISVRLHAQISVVGSEQNSISNEITYVGSGTAATASSGNVTPGLPGGTAVDDILICVVESRDNVVHSMAGWTMLNTGTSGTRHRASLFWRRATGGDPATVTHNAGNGIAARIMAFRGVSTATAFDTTNSFTVSPSDDNVEAAAISTVTANTMLVFTQHMAENYSSVANPAGSSPWTNAFLTELDLGGNNDDLTISAHYGLRTATGGQPAVQAAFSPAGGSAGVSHGAQLALRPATSLTALNINVPGTTSTGDVMVAAIAVRPSSVTITPPSGWTSISRVEQTAGNANVQEIFYRLVDGSEPASYTWNFSMPVIGAVGGVITYRDVNTITPIDVYGGNVTPSGTAHTATGVTTTMDNDMVISAHSFSSSETWTPPGGMTEEVDIASLTPSHAGGISLEINDVLQASAGATGDKTAAAAGNADYGVAHILALHPTVTTPVEIGEWRLDETSWNGTSGEVMDYTGNGLAGVSINDADTEYINPVVSGSTGSCRYGEFTAANNQYIQIGDNPLLDINDELTVTAWVNPGSLPASDVMTIMSKNNNYEIHLKPSGAVSWTWNNDSSAARSFDSTATISTSDTSGPYSNGWHHIAIVYTRSEQIIYIDGIAESNPSPYTNEDLQTTGDALLIGSDLAMPGRSFNGQIDEVRVYGNKALNATEISDVMNETHTCPIDVPQHYAISFPNGNMGSSCIFPVVEITAHDNSHDVLNVVAGISMDISTSTGQGVWQPALLTGTGTWTPSGADDGAATYVWPGGESSLQAELSHATTTAPGVNINLIDGTASDPGDGGSEDPYLEFSLDPIVRITPDGTSDSSVGTQIAGKNSDQAPGQTLYIQLKQSGVSVGGRDGCEVPGEYSGSSTVTVAMECINPASCSGQQVTVNGSPVNSLYDNGTVPDPLVGTGINFTFDGTGGSDIDTDNKAGLAFNFADTGLVKLHFSVTMDPSGPASLTPQTTFTGSTNDFISRPFGYSLESSDGNINAADADGTVFKKAGETFDLKLRAVVWQSADDANQDGMPDSGAVLTDNAVTPNFGNEDAHATATITHSLVLPPGDPGTLSGGTAIDGFNDDGSDSDTINSDLNPGETMPTLSFDEVGIIDLTALTSSYLGVAGADIMGTLANVGRFVPDRFNITDNSPALLNECTSGPAPFTYMDQNFYFDTPPVLTITALNTGGQTTKNYGGNFWKLGSTLSSRTYTDQVGGPDHGFSGTVMPSVTLGGNTDYDGTGTLAIAAGPSGDIFMYGKINPESPFAADINLDITSSDLTDSDNVCYDLNDDDVCDSYSISNIGGAELRFGRLIIDEDVGSEEAVLNVAFDTEYYNSGVYVINTDDMCTTIADTAPANAVPDLVLSNEIEIDQTDGEIRIGGACAATTTMTLTNNPFAAGQGLLEFSPPGTDCTGFADISINLTGMGLDHLLFDWNGEDEGGDGLYDDNPTGRASFGIISRPKQVIYTREPW